MILAVLSIISCAVRDLAVDELKERKDKDHLIKSDMVSMEFVTNKENK